MHTRVWRWWIDVLFNPYDYFQMISLPLSQTAPSSAPLEHKLSEYTSCSPTLLPLSIVVIVSPLHSLKICCLDHCLLSTIDFVSILKYFGIYVDSLFDNLAPQLFCLLALSHLFFHRTSYINPNSHTLTLWVTCITSKVSIVSIPLPVFHFLFFQLTSSSTPSLTIPCHYWDLKSFDSSIFPYSLSHYALNFPFTQPIILWPIPWSITLLHPLCVRTSSMSFPITFVKENHSSESPSTPCLHLYSWIWLEKMHNQAEWPHFRFLTTNIKSALSTVWKCKTFPETMWRTLGERTRLGARGLGRLHMRDSD